MLSTAALSAQCRTGIEPYPHGDLPPSGQPRLRNRADCIALMRGVSTGTVDPGVAPLFLGGQRP